MRAGQSRRVALCGVLGALSLVLLMLGNLFPLATYCAPALAAALLVPPLQEYGVRWALTLYAAVALLAVLLLPDKELAVMYALVLGYYPAAKAGLDRIRPRAVRAAAKLAVFNAAVLLAYWLLLAVFPLPGLAEEFAGMGRAMTAALLATGSLSFLVFDLALDRLTLLYRRVWRKKLKPFL